MSGCQTVHTQEPLPDGWSADDPHARTEFWSLLPNRAVVGNDEVFHALLLYMDGQDPSAGYAARVAALKSRKLLPLNFDGKANDVANRGTLAVALVRVLKIDGGVSLHLFGDVPRYAVRALEFRGVYAPCSPNQAISGGQFVGIMQKAEEYERGNPADAPAAKLPSEALHPGGPLAAAANARQTIVPGKVPDGNPEAPEQAFTMIPPDAFALNLRQTADAPAYRIDLAELYDPNSAGCAPSLAMDSWHGRPARVSDLDSLAQLRAIPVACELRSPLPCTHGGGLGGLGWGPPPQPSPGVPGEGVNRLASRENLEITGGPPVPHPLDHPFFLDGAATAPATAPAAGFGAAARTKKLNVIITGVEGDSAEVRKTPQAAWVRARVGMVVHDSAEFRTGAKSAIRFIIPPDQTFCLDSQGTTKVLDAVADGNKVKTDIGLSHGRVRYDVDKGTANAGEPVRIEQAGIEHDATIRSPNSALALRGTKVSLFDQPGYDPEAISLSGAAIYVNTRGQRIAFGGKSRAALAGAQTSAAQAAGERVTASQSPNLAEQDFATRETSIVIQRGGFITGDVVVGSLHLSDFHNKLPGALDFVLQWTPTKAAAQNDLNLAVFSPKYSPTFPDFVANPPYSDSLTPSNPTDIAIRARFYPETSPTGGSISKNSVGPDGLELASWPASYPPGTYRIRVFNYIDAVPPPAMTINPVRYTVEVFLNGTQLPQSFTGTVGFLQTSSVISIDVPATTPGTTATTKARPKPAPAAKTPAAQTPKPPASVKNPVKPGR